MESPSTGGHTRSPPRGPYLEFDLTRELEELHREPKWKSGHNAKTLVKCDDLRLDVEAVEDSAVLLSIAWHPEGEPPAV